MNHLTQSLVLSYETSVVATQIRGWNFHPFLGGNSIQLGPERLMIFLLEGIATHEVRGRFNFLW